MHTYLTTRPIYLSPRAGDSRGTHPWLKTGLAQVGFLLFFSSLEPLSQIKFNLYAPLFKVDSLFKWKACNHIALGDNGENSGKLKLLVHGLLEIVLVFNVPLVGIKHPWMKETGLFEQRDYKSQIERIDRQLKKSSAPGPNCR